MNFAVITRRVGYEAQSLGYLGFHTRHQVTCCGVMSKVLCVCGCTR